MGIITQNGQIVTVNGSALTYEGGGLEYEEGTWTPTADTVQGTISFSNIHTLPPSFYMVEDVSEKSTSAVDDIVSLLFADYYLAFGSAFPASTSDIRWGAVQIVLRTSSGLAGTMYTISYNSDAPIPQSLTTAYSRYWATEVSICPSGASGRYFRSGRTYKWLAVWA